MNDALSLIALLLSFGVGAYALRGKAPVKGSRLR